MNARKADMQGIADGAECGLFVLFARVGQCPAHCGLFGLFAPARKPAEQRQWSSVRVIWPVCAGTETGAEQCQWSSVQVIWPVRTGTETSRAVSVELRAGYLACSHRHAQLKE